MKKILPFILIALTLISCTSTQNNEAKTDTDEHPAFEALEWEGTYTGTEPCKDCDLVRTSVTLKGDKTYELRKDYVGGKSPMNLAGDFDWSEAGTLRLYVENKDKLDDFIFRIAEGLLIPLDKNGNIIEGYSMLKKLDNKD